MLRHVGLEEIRNGNVEIGYVLLGKRLVMEKMRVELFC